MKVECPPALFLRGDRRCRASSQISKPIGSISERRLCITPVTMRWQVLIAAHAR